MTTDVSIVESVSVSATDNSSTSAAPIRPRIAVVIPCYNEEFTVGRVVDEFRRALPTARLFVFDNNSTDGTANIGRDHGAAVVRSPRQGKGYVVQHMFDTVDADIYVMVDGDDTYPAEAAPLLIETLRRTGADMVVGARLSDYERKAFRKFHRIGNVFLARLISWLFGVNVTDVLSGYRVFSREFVKTVPLSSGGFEVETELTLQAAAKHFQIVEVPVQYGIRPAGSASKLNTFADGYLILKTLVQIFRDYKPEAFFTLSAVLLAACSLLAGVLPILDYYQTRYVSHVPLAILAAALGVLSALQFGVGLILGTVHRYHNETFRLWRRYLKRLPGRSSPVFGDHAQNGATTAPMDEHSCIEA